MKKVAIIAGALACLMGGCAKAYMRKMELEAVTPMQDLATRLGHLAGYLEAHQNRIAEKSEEHKEAMAAFQAARRQWSDIASRLSKIGEPPASLKGYRELADAAVESLGGYLDAIERALIGPRDLGVAQRQIASRAEDCVNKLSALSRKRRELLRLMDYERG